MIASVMAYGSAVALLLGLAGLMLERIALWQAWTRRGVWGTSTVLSVALPAVLILLAPRSDPQQDAIGQPPLTLHFEPHGSPVPMVPAVPSAVPGVTVAFAKHVTPTTSQPRSAEPLFARLWLLASLGVVALYSCLALRLKRASRQWRQEHIGAQEVWVTHELGPAVVGFLKPRILMPAWVFDGPVDARSLVLAHEQEHLAAHDPQLHLCGLVLVVLTPWNLPLWWQLHRLRFAIEVDCDARVIRRGTDARMYGEVLLRVARRRTLTPAGAIALTEPASQLLQRIQILFTELPRRNRWLIGLVAGLSLTCGALALDLKAPSLSNVELLKPPLRDSSPYLPKAEAAARAAYPETFTGGFDGTVAIRVFLDRNGNILDIQRRSYPAGALGEHPDDFDADRFAELEHGPAGTAGQKFIGWFGPQDANGLYLFYQVNKWKYDPLRSGARARTAVSQRYPEFFRPYPAESLNQQTGMKHLTVFMNDDGSINRAKLDDLPTNWPGYDERQRFRFFIDMGLTPEQFGHRGSTTNLPNPHSLKRYPNAPLLDIDYAWPRRADDPPDMVFQSNAVFQAMYQRKSQEVDTQPSDEDFVKSYFPDIWLKGPTQRSEELWVLLDASGRVCSTGQHTPADVTAIVSELKGHYPAATIKAELATSAKTATGVQQVAIAYLRLAPDSRITACQALVTATPGGSND